MNDDIEWVVGGKVFFVPSESYMGTAGYLTITKIGRTWAYLSNVEIDSPRYAVDMRNGRVASAGDKNWTVRCKMYRDESDYFDHARADFIRQEVRRTVDYLSKCNVSVEQFDAIAEILGIEVPSKWKIKAKSPS
jgi:hypothetical protein